MKKVLSLILTAVMILSLVPLSMFAVSAEETVTDEQGIRYTVSHISENGTLSEVYSVSSYSGELSDIVIPEEFNGKIVKLIKDNAFSYCDSLTSIEIPDSIIRIGSFSFYNCKNLTNINISDSVINIGENAFLGCENLQYNIYDNGKYLGNSKKPYLALIDVVSTDITSCDIHKDTKILLNAFSGCSSLESIAVSSENQTYKSSGNCLIAKNINTLVLGCNNSVIPTDGSVISIANDAFRDCDGLTSITIPDSVTSIGDSAFYGCDGLTSVVIGDSVTEIGGYYGAYVFAGCKNLKNVVIGDSVELIGDYAFSGCTSLESIVLSDSVRWVGSHAFSGCDNLKHLTIGASFYASRGAVSVGDGCGYGFAGLSDTLETITVSPENTTYKSVNNCLIVYDKYLYLGCKNSVIPSDGSIEVIYNSAFEGCDITNINIPDSVTTIGNYAFSGCEKLTSIAIPDSVTSIGAGAFSGCDKLTSIVIPASVTTIKGEDDYGWPLDEYTFADCDNLTDIYCEAVSQPEGWGEKWSSGCDATVHWGYVSPDNTKPTLGNIDGDGDVDASDYILIKRAVLKTFNLAEEQKSLADIDKDNDVDATDYVLVKRIVLGTYTAK